MDNICPYALVGSYLEILELSSGFHHLYKSLPFFAAG